MLHESLRANHDQILQYLYLGRAHWDVLLEKVAREERVDRVNHGCFSDEQVWTFLVACSYAAAGPEGVQSLRRELIGNVNVDAPQNSKIWFEVLPPSPRINEGRTNLDLAIGTVAVEQGTESGIIMADCKNTWICFTEFKWYSDISKDVSYDVNRNQLARVIENALYFRNANGFCNRVFVTLVTPSIFRGGMCKSRLYQYKFEDYSNDNNRNLISDLNACVMPPANAGFQIENRVNRLSLKWVTYDELFNNIPQSPISGEIAQFWTTHGNYQGRQQQNHLPNR